MRTYSEFQARRLSDALGLTDSTTDVDAAQAEAVEVITAALTKLHAVADARSVYVRGVLQDAIHIGLTYDAGEYRQQPTEGVPGVRSLPLYVSRVGRGSVLMLDGEKVTMPDVAGDIGAAVDEASAAAGLRLDLFNSWNATFAESVLGTGSVKPGETLREGGRVVWEVTPIVSAQELAIQQDEEAEVARQKAEEAARREAEKEERRGPRGPRPVPAPQSLGLGQYARDAGYLSRGGSFVA